MGIQTFRIKNGISVGVGGTILTTSSQGNIGINSTIPTSRLDVVGDLKISNTITANQFIGDGSSLIGVIGIGSGVDIWNNNSKVGRASTINFSNEFNVSSIVNGVANVSNALTLDSITSLGNITNNSISVGNISADVVNAYSFVGYGNSLKNIPGTNVVSYSSASDISNSALSISGITTYTQVGILSGPSQNFPLGGSSLFGNSVAISANGKTMVVGSPNEMRTVGVGTTYGGYVYVFDRISDTFSNISVLRGPEVNTSPSTGLGFDSSKFGNTVKITSDGNTIFVSAPNEEVSTTPLPNKIAYNKGSVYIFDRAGIGSTEFNFVGIITSLEGISLSYYSYMGEQIECNSDGSIFFVQQLSYLYPNSSVAIYERNENSFNRIGIVTGSSALYADDKFGYSLACSADGNIIAIGAPNDESSGKSGVPEGEVGLVHVYNRLGNSFNSVGILTGSLVKSHLNVTVQGDYFGKSVAITPDGKSIVVGASYDEMGQETINTGLSYVFDQKQETYLFSNKDGNIGIGTTNTTSKLTVGGDVLVSGVVTATGGFNLGIQSSGFNVTTGVVTALNFVGMGYSFSYNAGTKTVDIDIAGPQSDLASRQSVQGTTSSIAIGSTANLTIFAAKSYILHKVGVSTAAWVRIYTDSNSRQSDSSRLETVDPAPGSGVIAEVITSGISTELITPGSMGFNNDDPPTSNVYLAVTNKGTSTQAITVTLNYLPLEV